MEVHNVGIEHIRQFKHIESERWGIIGREKIKGKIHITNAKTSKQKKFGPSRHSDG